MTKRQRVPVAVGRAHQLELRTLGLILAAATGPLACDAASPRLPALMGALAISAGGYHACAALTDGTAKCWGDDEFGQLGDGASPLMASTAVTVDSSGVTSVSAGGSHTCARLGDATVRCWGDNVFGELGNGVVSPDLSSSPVPVVALTAVASVVAAGASAGGLELDAEFSCALLMDGTAQCWGDDTYSELGPGTFTQAPQTTPVPVAGVMGAVALAVGGEHACALSGGGTVSCWGNTLTILTTSPEPVAGIAGAKALAIGEEHYCALLDDGTVACWGDNAYGQLGNGATSPGVSVTTPSSVGQLAGATAISAGANHTCALLGDGTVRCWGLNEAGQLGNGSAMSQATTPTTVGGLASVVAISAGGDLTCALIVGGTVKCWGDDSYGQLGDGLRIDSTTPVTVTSGL